jgi:threonine dehydratase
MTRTGAVLIHPYNNYRVIAGQGTCALEFHEQVEEGLDLLLAPVGGGGLISGTALAMKSLSPGTWIIGCEPKGADDAFQSKQAGKIILQAHPQTIADGLRSSLGDKTFPVIQKLVDDIITVSEDEIIEAMRHIWERMKIIVEPSGAVAVAGALFKRPAGFADKRIGIILSGGNVDLDHLPFKR